VRGFLMPSPELAQRRKGIKTHRPVRSSVAGFLSLGSPQRTRQSFCAAKSWQLKNLEARSMVRTVLLPLLIICISITCVMIKGKAGLNQYV